MKKLILLPLLIVFLCGKSFAQESEYIAITQNQISDINPIFYDSKMDLSGFHSQALVSKSNHLRANNGYHMYENIVQNWDSTYWLNYGRKTYKYYLTNDSLYEKIEYAWLDDHWENSAKYNISYNTSRYPIELLVKQWDEESWVNASKSIYIYIDDTVPYQHVLKTWDGSGWVDIMKFTFDTDTNNNIIQMLAQSWYSMNWVNEWKEFFTYDENNKQIEWFRQSWNDPNWTNRYRYLFYYDVDLKLVEELHTIWKDDEWMNNLNIFYRYDLDNMLNEVTDKHWFENEWRTNSKQKLSYDLDNNLIKIIGQRWNESQWKDASKTTNFYYPVSSDPTETKRNDINKSIEDFQTTVDDLVIEPPDRTDKMLIGVEVLLDDIKHTSVGDLEITLTHNDITQTLILQDEVSGENFMQTKLTDNAWDHLSAGVAPYAGNFTTENPLSPFLETDPVGTWTLGIYDRAEGNTGTLQAWGLNLIYSSGTSSIEDEIIEIMDMNLFPNPAAVKISLHSAVFSQQSTIIKVYDLNGKKLIEQRIPKGAITFEIKVNDLTNGIYFCKITSGKTSTTKKLIIQK